MVQFRLHGLIFFLKQQLAMVKITFFALVLTRCIQPCSSKTTNRKGSSKIPEFHVGQKLHYSLTHTPNTTHSENTEIF